MPPDPVPGGRWLKLDTRVVDGFDAALGDRGLRVATGTAAVLSDLAARIGWARAIGALFRAVARPRPALVEGNVARKRIRVPTVFGLPWIAAPYRWLKAVQAALLSRRLEAEFMVDSGLSALVYNGSLYPESVLADVALRLGRRRVFVEAGFFPGTLQFDPKGLNAANSVPRDPAFYLDRPEDFAAGGLPQLTHARPVKARGEGPVALPPHYVFVAFQVPSDMQVTLHSPWVRDMAQFLAIIRDAAERNPGETFVVKEHPSFPRSVRDRFPPHPRVIFANDNVTRELIEGARAVITLNSTVGLEALLLDRPVIVLAEACYDIDGLVLRARDEGSFDAALGQSRTWRPDERLRRQVLGWLWSRYLSTGSYADPPADLPVVLDRVAGRSFDRP